LFINDLCEVSKVLQFLMFADDTYIFYSRNNLPEIAEYISSEMVKIKEWCDKKQVMFKLGENKIHDLW